MSHSGTQAWLDWTLGDAIGALDTQPGVGAVVAAMLPTGDPFAGIAEVLVQATTALYPAWLPQAVGINDASDASVAAVRRLASRVAEQTALFGPVVEALAARSVGGYGDLADVPIETLVRECHKLVCRSYGTMDARLVLDTEGDAADVPHLVAWLTSLDAFDLTLVGRAAAALPATIWADRSVPVADTQSPMRGLVHLSAVAGRPSPLSETEQRIEARLRECPWAAGRAWNRQFVANALDAPVYPDLMFGASRLVVEFDGPDHLNRTKYEADRQRDRMLQKYGFAVFRFTNREIQSDIERVIGEIATEVARRTAH